MATQEHHDDIAHIARALQAEAERRGWGDDYTRFAENVSAGLIVPLTGADDPAENGRQAETTAYYGATLVVAVRLPQGVERPHSDHVRAALEALCGGEREYSGYRGTVTIDRVASQV